MHPDDEAYAFSGRYLCSPSLVLHPDGYLLASTDLYEGNHPQNLTLIFRLDDGEKPFALLLHICVVLTTKTEITAYTKIRKISSITTEAFTKRWNGVSGKTMNTAMPQR